MTKEQERIKELESEVSRLTALVNDLLQKMNKKQIRKDSNNSSVPPSKDENRPRKTQSLRKKSIKKPGGQTGHQGNTLKMAGSPDHTIDYKPDYCIHCGNRLGGSTMQLSDKRQVVDIPVVAAQYTEHRVYKTTCTCGQVCKASFPKEAKAPICYGSNTEALIAYMYSRQYLPSERLQELLRDIYGLPISEGSIFNILGRFVKKSESVYEAIRCKIGTSKVVGADETGIRVNGNHHWGWTWQNEEATFIAITPNRGSKTINQYFENGLPDTILVHDCWRPHLNTHAATHQLCIAHLLRELKYFDQRFAYPWSKDFSVMLLDALALRKNFTRVDFYYPNRKRNDIEQKLKQLLKQDIPAGMKDLQTFQNRIGRYKDYLFTFLYHPEVPPDNNASERAIRNLKVKQKISGQFKSEKGARNFSVIRSITDTCLKNKQNVLNALNLIARS